MDMKSFQEKIKTRWTEVGFMSVGLDPVVSKIPDSLKQAHSSVFDLIRVFDRAIIDATADLVCAFKPNSGFYESEGIEGLKALKATVDYIHEVYPDIPVIVDAKRGDIGSTSEAYARAVFDELGADAVTVQPYLGQTAIQPFLDRDDKGIFILARTSNEGAGEFQDLLVGGSNTPLYLHVAMQVANVWNKNKNCGLVVGATAPDELKAVREVVGDIPILIPGVGAQGGDAARVIEASALPHGGIILNSSRGVLYASSGADFAEAARASLIALKSVANGTHVL